MTTARPGVGRRASFAERKERRAQVDDPAVVLEAAARFLEPRARSVVEVRRRLTGAGYQNELVEGAITRMLELGMNPTTVSAQTQAHASALHHAVWSGSLDAVKVLVEAGADLDRRDTLYDGTPLGWARHCEQGNKDESKQYREIAAYLCEKGAQ